MFRETEDNKVPRYRIDPSRAKPVESHEDSELKIPKKRAKGNKHGKRKCIKHHSTNEILMSHNRFDILQPKGRKSVQKLVLKITLT